MTQKKESPIALQRDGASKKFNLAKIEHLVDSPLIEVNQGVSDNNIEHQEINNFTRPIQGRKTSSGKIHKLNRSVWCDARRVQNEATLLVAKNSLKPSPKPNFRPLPTIEEISAAFDVDPDVGDPINKVRRPRLSIGAICGTTKTDYITVYLKGVPWRWHRLAWKLYNGNDPVGLIDHINGCLLYTSPSPRDRG